MLSADQLKTVGRKLTHWLENEKRVVTYRDVSREIGCHVNTAKNILLNHYNSNPTSLNATYLLTGPLLQSSTLTQTELTTLNQSMNKDSKSLIGLGGTQKVRIRDMDEVSEGDRNSEDEDAFLDDLEGEVGNDRGLLGEESLPFGAGSKRSFGTQGDGDGEGDGEGEEDGVEDEKVKRWGVVLVQQDKLNEKKNLFESDSLTIHIYSLSPSPITDPAQYLVSSITLRDKPNYHDKVYGTITGTAAGPTAASATAATTAGMRDGAMDWGKKPEQKVPVPATKKVEQKVVQDKKTAETNRAQSQTNKSTTTPTLAAEAEVEAETSSSSKIKSKTKPPTKTQTQSQSKKKRIVQSDTESDGDGDDDQEQKVKKVETEPTSSMVRADDKAAMEAMMSMDMDVDLSDEEKDVKPDLKKLNSKQGATATGGKRKRRRVKKSVQEIDAKGYMVTKDHWSDESYSGESEPEAKTQTKSSNSNSNSRPLVKGRESTASIDSTGAAGKEDKKFSSSSFGGKSKSSAAGSGRATGQSTLKGFFTKK